jgi:hypothetical protein
MRRDDEIAGWRGALRLLGPALALLTGMLSAPAEGLAQSRICRQLESQLAGVSRGGDGGQAQRYDRAIDQQRAQLDKGERQYRRAGCGGGLFWQGSGGASCDALGRGLDRMERNLSQLERTRARMGDGRADPRRERARILASLDANDCRVVRQEQRQAETADRGNPGGILAQIFGGGVRKAEPRREDSYRPLESSARVRTIIGGEGSIATLGGGGGSYRTLCVRTCDGYYWPVSYSSSQSDFRRDEQNCQTMCPGTEVKLYSHRVPDEESENMVDAYGAAYTDLATAFKYRDASAVRPEGCSCRAQKKSFTVVGGEGLMSLPADAETPTIALPVPRPDPAADPETLANREGKFDAGDMKRLAEARPDVSSLEPAGERRVRVVGPAYLPDPEAAIDLQAPGQPLIR